MSLVHIIFDHDGTLVDVDSSGTHLFIGMREFLDQLRDSGVKIYVWTARDRHSTLESLKSHSLLDYFEDISTATDAQMKPSVEGLQMMLEGVDSSTICVIGDNATDVIGAKAFKAMAIGATWNDPSIYKAEYLKEYGADYVFDNIKECREQVMSLVKTERKNV